MDGLLVIDKPTGPTSHDIVATARRVLRERRIGHTGTLDPMASGVLPLVIGRATRLAQFLSASEKEYEAIVRLGITTDTGDRLGTMQGAEYLGPWPEAVAIERALDAFRGMFSQQPPVYSAKKIAGRRSHRLARAQGREQGADLEAQPRPAPVLVTTSAVQLTGTEGPLVSLRLVCSAGFYVRALAADLGAALGTGGHLSALRRTRSGRLGLDQAIAFDTLVTAAPGDVPVIGLDQMLPEIPEVLLTAEGEKRALHGQDVGRAHASGPWPDTVTPVAASALPGDGYVRLRGPSGELVAIAEHAPTPGFLHPAVVLK